MNNNTATSGGSSKFRDEQEATNTPAKGRQWVTELQQITEAGRSKTMEGFGNKDEHFKTRIQCKSGVKGDQDLVCMKAFAIAHKLIIFFISSYRFLLILGFSGLTDITGMKGRKPAA